MCILPSFVPRRFPKGTLSLCESLWDCVCQSQLNCGLIVRQNLCRVEDFYSKPNQGITRDGPSHPEQLLGLEFRAEIFITHRREGTKKMFLAIAEKATSFKLEPVYFGGK